MTNDLETKSHRPLQQSRSWEQYKNEDGKIPNRLPYNEGIPSYGIFTILYLAGNTVRRETAEPADFFEDEFQGRSWQLKKSGGNIAQEIVLAWKEISVTTPQGEVIQPASNNPSSHTTE